MTACICMAAATVTALAVALERAIRAVLFRLLIVLPDRPRGIPRARARWPR